MNTVIRKLTMFFEKIFQCTTINDAVANLHDNNNCVESNIDVLRTSLKEGVGKYIRHQIMSYIYVIPPHCCST